MATIIHLEPEEFVEKLFVHKKQLRVTPLVLEDGIAVMVYMFTGLDRNIYYMDRALSPLKEEISEIPSFDLHKDLYRKVALDQELKGFLD